jgi:hypothetical protein
LEDNQKKLIISLVRSHKKSSFTIKGSEYKVSYTVCTYYKRMVL